MQCVQPDAPRGWRHPMARRDIHFPTETQTRPGRSWHLLSAKALRGGSQDGAAPPGLQSSKENLCQLPGQCMRCTCMCAWGCPPLFHGVKEWKVGGTHPHRQTGQAGRLLPKGPPKEACLPRPRHLIRRREPAGCLGRCTADLLAPQVSHSDPTKTEPALWGHTPWCSGLAPGSVHRNHP